jgi:hypothetical protein
VYFLAPLPAPLVVYMYNSRLEIAVLKCHAALVAEIDIAPSIVTVGRRGGPAMRRVCAYERLPSMYLSAHQSQQYM